MTTGTTSMSNGHNLTRKRKRPSQPVRSSTTEHKSTNQGGYEVGYGRPPKHSRFKPGKSPNPKGRPRKEKPQTLKSLVIEELLAPMTISENGKKIKLPAIQVVLRRLSVEAAKGNIPAIRLNTNLANQFLLSGHDEINLTPEQEQLLQEILNDE